MKPTREIDGWWFVGDAVLLAGDAVLVQVLAGGDWLRGRVLFDKRGTPGHYVGLDDGDRIPLYDIAAIVSLAAQAGRRPV